MLNESTAASQTVFPGSMGICKITLFLYSIEMINILNISSRERKIQVQIKTVGLFIGIIFIIRLLI